MNRSHPNFTSPGLLPQPSMNPTWNSLPRASIPISTVNNNISFPLHTNTSSAPISNDSFHYNPRNDIDLDDYIGVLKQFVSVAETTVKQVSDLVKLNLSAVDPELSCCPFNPHHRMPPQYLFRHSLCCSSSPATVDLNILSDLRYPNTLKSEKELNAETQAFKPLQGFGSDVCISIEEDGLLDCNFFYKDAPGVVSSSQQETKYFFTLPSTLSVECVNPRCGTEAMGLSGNGGIKLLPSEFWALRRELAAWNDFPSKYSFVVLETAMGLGKVKESKIIRWILLNSPSYEIIIDLPMARHIFLLLKVCLRAILREASEIYLREWGSVKDQDENKTDMVPLIKNTDMLGNLRTSHFGCPVLLESMVWLASQVSVLYSQSYSNGFVMGMLKHSFACAGSALLPILIAEPLRIVKTMQDLPKMSNAADLVNVSEMNVNTNAVREGTQISGSPMKEREEDVKFRENLRKNISGLDCNLQSEDRSGENDEVEDGNILDGKVFVSQVAAAVSALHERSLLEERIKGLRHSERLSKYQMLGEHETAVRKAVEERRRRVDYKPILEHDGLVWQRSNSQWLHQFELICIRTFKDSKKHKTREELLAEERDYKRRRMSYRGKKVKRTPTKVLRDIIEGHMEEIKLAGGIGCFVKGASETSLIATESLSSHIVAESTQLLGSANSSLSRRGEQLSSSNNKGMQSDSIRITSSEGCDDGNVDLKEVSYCKSRSPQMNLQRSSDGNRLDKHDRHWRHDHYDDDGKDGRDGELMYNYCQNDNECQYSGSLFANRFHERRETRRDGRSQDMKLDTSIRSHERNYARRSCDRLEGGYKSRSHERKYDDSHDRYRRGDSYDRYESGRSYVSYGSAPSSKEHSRGRKGDGWRSSTDNEMDNDYEIKSRSKSTAKRRDRDRHAES